MKSHRTRTTWFATARIAGPFALVFCAVSVAADEPPLELVRTITLKGPAGRLDHLALDYKRGRLFVANMPNASLDVVDLNAGKLLKQIPDQKGIQGVAYARDLDRIFVGNGDGNACNVFDGQDHKLIKSFSLDDADNVRYHAATHRVYVAHAENALAVIDAKDLKTITDIKLPGPPEGFQLEQARDRLYVNTKSPSLVVAIDTKKNEVIARYPLTLASANYPMALDESTHRIFVGCRKGPKIVVLDSESGKEVTSVPIPDDVDDVFFDARRKRIYASCGEGAIAVIRQIDADHYELLAKVATAKVARTCLFDAESDRLFLVVPRQEGKDGPEIWIYQVRT